VLEGTPARLLLGRLWLWYSYGYCGQLWRWGASVSSRLAGPLQLVEVTIQSTDSFVLTGHLFVGGMPSRYFVRCAACRRELLQSVR
jgi:hypothetical protein